MYTEVMHVFFVDNAHQLAILSQMNFNIAQLFELLVEQVDIVQVWFRDDGSNEQMIV